MNILMIHTCADEGLVAVADEAGLMQSELLPGRSSSETVTGAVRRMLALAQTLDVVAVVHGPGSFTGVRVGLSIAKGLCEARGARLLAISRLALVAGEDGIALLDAGRGELFCGVYERGRMVSERLLHATEVAALGEGTSWLGERVPVTCEARVMDRFQGEIRLIAEPGAAEILALARTRIAAGQWSDLATQDANYLRRTDAELLVEAR